MRAHAERSWMDVWMDGWADARTDGRTDGQDEYSVVCVHNFVLLNPA